MNQKRILLVSDVHYCHIDNLGIPTGERMERLKNDLRLEFEKSPYERILFLGDYSLDFWKWQIKGSWLTQGICNTETFIRTVCEGLNVPYQMLAGNHEQYGNEVWKRMTGNERNFRFSVGNYLFICWDSFAADLDPTEHSDGTYTSLPVSWIRSVMDEEPDKKVILCSHFFDEKAESPEGLHLLKDSRVLCLFCGHTHQSNILTLSEEAGHKAVLFTGNYSEAGEKKISTMWGYRELILQDDRIESSYIIPENHVFVNGQPTHFHKQKVDQWSLEIT